MGNIERSEKSNPPFKELCFANHFYAAYVFDQAEIHQKDISTIIEESHNLGYPVRYWWLSQAMDIQNNPDRLIICVHHPSHDENAGMDLLNSLYAKQVKFDELDAAVREEYVFWGRRIAAIESISKPNGVPLFEARRV